MTFKAGMTVKVIDAGSKHCGASGPVISTSTRDDMHLVGVRIAAEGTVWFVSSQLEQTP